MENLFDPFNDRTARDIRNSLSSALTADLTGSGGRQQVSQTAERWLARDLAPVYREYIEHRRAHYRDVIRRICASKLNNPAEQAILLWNDGLFFELHELLELMWRKAVEPERTALKGWIQAAGVYVHSRRGNHDAAGKLAQRACKNLRAAAGSLSFISNLEDLLEALRQPDPDPPSLRRKD